MDTTAQQSNSIETAERHETGKVDCEYRVGSRTDCLKEKVLKALGLSEDEAEE